MKKISKGFIKTYMKLATPAIIANLVTYGVDALITSVLGSLSEKAIAGYTYAFESYHLYYFIALGTTGGFHIFISQLYGDGNKVKYNQVLRVGLKILTALGLVFSAGMCIFAKQFVGLFVKNDAEILQYGVDFLRIYAWGHLLYGVNLLFSGLYTIIGKAKVAMYSGMLNCFSSLISTFLFVKVLNMGVQGAALGVVVGRLSEFVFLLYSINRNDSVFKFSEKYPKFKGHEIIEIFKTSLPLAVNEVLYSLAFMLVVKNLSYLSEVDTCCYTIADTCNKIFFCVAFGLSPVVGTEIGLNLGKGNFEKAKESARDILWITFFTHLIFGVVLVVLAPIIPSFFSLENETAEICTKCLIIKAVLGLFGGYTNCFYNIERIGGDTKRILLSDGIFSFVFPFTVSYLVTHIIPLPFEWAYFCIEAMNIIKTAIGYYFYKQGHWLKKLS